MRVGLIGCGAEKLPYAAPARSLYGGTFFRLCRDWMETHAALNEWAILSAKYGLVLPDMIIEPYDLALTSLPEEARREWQDRTGAQIRERWGADVIYTVLAGGEYRAATNDLPYVEDVIGGWRDLRRVRGMRRPELGIGVIQQYIKHDLARRGFA